MSEARDRGNAKVRRHRLRLRERGLRPVQIWVPDETAPGYAERIRQQCLAANAADVRSGIMDWIEDVSLFDEEG